MPRTAARDRDREFAEFFAGAWPRLFGTVYAVAGDRSQAEDALQSAFAKAYASWARVRDADQPEAYVRRMAVNEVLAVRRRAWWRSEEGGDASEPAPLASHEDRSVERQTMSEAVAQLSVGQRAVVVLRYYEGLTEAEIAEVLGCSRGTVTSQASDALARLRTGVATSREVGHDGRGGGRGGAGRAPGPAADPER